MQTDAQGQNPQPLTKVVDTQSQQIWASISGHHQNTWVRTFMVELGYSKPKENLGTT